MQAEHVETSPTYRNELRKAIRSLESATQSQPESEHDLMMIIVEIRELLGESDD